ncbi:Chaperone protein HscA [Buchnera aphidicola (Neophyllaphis podocarpi)]
MDFMNCNTFFLNNFNKKIKKIAGIDLGTTYSAISTVINNKVKIIPDQNGNLLLPSIVCYKRDRPIVGWNAVNKFKSNDIINTINSAKRLLGYSLSDINQNKIFFPYIFKKNKYNKIIIKTNYGFVTPEIVLGDILKSLKNRFLDFCGKILKDVVITVPAYFNNKQRQQVKNSAYLANLNVLRLLNEPTAAALAYGFKENKKHKIILVYDLGGGTFDVSILRISNGVFEVLSTGGNNKLGGDDFDEQIANLIIKKSNINVTNYPHLKYHLLKLSSNIKFQLTHSYFAKINFLNWKGTITRKEFEELIYSLIYKTILICDKTIKEANLSIKDINDIIMVGGSTHVPLVIKLVSDFFNKNLLNYINPEKSVVMGAGIQAEILSGNKNIQESVLLLDVVPLSLGIETVGGFVEKIINKNTNIPFSKTQEFTTLYDNQKSIFINILQGEREFVKDCFSLGKFSLNNLPLKSAGQVRISVTFTIDVNCMLIVTAEEKSKNLKNKIKIDIFDHLNKLSVDKIIKDSKKHLPSDLYNKLINDYKIKSEKIINNLNPFLSSDSNLLDKKELSDLIKFKNLLKKSLEEKDINNIEFSMSKLEQKSDSFFKQRLNNSIKSYFSKDKI